MAWGSCTRLQKTKPRPVNPHAVHLSSEADPVRLPDCSSGGPTSGPSLSTVGVSGSSPGLRYFFDHVSVQQNAAIDDSILRFFVACRISFRVAESTAFLAMLKALRPGYVARKRVPTRRQMAGPLLTRLYELLMEHVMRTLSVWCSRRKAVLVLDGWENIRHNHIVNLMAIVGGVSVFLDSMYCGDACQDANGQAQLWRKSCSCTGGSLSSMQSAPTTPLRVLRYGGW